MTQSRRPKESVGDEFANEVAVKPAALDEFGALIREIVPEDEAAEPRSRILECFIGGQNAHFYERYQDPAAALTHLQRFGENYASRLFALFLITHSRHAPI